MPPPDVTALERTLTSVLHRRSGATAERLVTLAAATLAPDRFRSPSTEARPEPPPFRSDAPFLDLLLELVAEGQAEGALAPGPPAAHADVLRAFFEGLDQLAAAGAPLPAATTLVARLLRDLAPDPDTPPPTPRGEAVLAVVRRADGRYLLVRRAAHLPGGRFWVPPGGRPLPGEPLPTAAARETFEETGLAVTPGSVCLTGTTADGSWALTWLSATPTDEAAADALTPDPSEVADLGWFTPAEALALHPLFPATRAFFAALPR